MLTYRQSSDLICIGYSDFDFTGCSDDKKLMTGYVFMLVGGAIWWKIVK